MFEIEKKHQQSPTQRAPLKKEAPLPLKDPGVERRAPTREKPNSKNPTQNKIDGLFKNRAPLEFDQNVGFQGGASARRKGYKLAMWSLMASLIDALILISVSCLFMLVFSVIVKTPVGSVMRALSHSQHSILFFIEIFFACAWVYMICVRSIMGYSIGEWACELRLGQPQERLSSKYVLRVAVRSTLILLTGVFTLPILSLLVGKDLAGVLSGLRLFSLK